MNEWGAWLEGALRIGKGGQRLVLDVDERGGVVGEGHALRDDRRHRHTRRVDDGSGQIGTRGL